MTAPWMIHIIDDDEAVRKSLLFALQAVDFRVSSYGGASEFLADADAERGVLICDVRMPGMNGIELTRLLQQRGSAMRVILVTGNASHTLKAEATSAGADALLEKPTALGALLEEIQRITAGWT